ncbi:MAG: DUF1947 domain-containing protein [Sulfolobales archaeon]|nr:DUF1947 domain-containing protein [Sulfolobales archaeon]MDW8083117.1 DUF1947 domain-containing protein [Sulfolobales archaeon]
MSIKIVYRALRRKESKQLIESICSLYPKICVGIRASSAETVYEAVFDGEVIYVVNGIPVVFKSENQLTPTLISARVAGFEALHYAVVDEGAVRPILSGADVMAPGIRRVSEFSIGDIVVIWSTDEKTPLAITRALMTYSEITSIRRGRALKNLHYAGDDIWKVSLEILKKFERL